jgi:hypothetical protein
MNNLVCCVSTGKGTWADVSKVIRAENWSKVYIVTNDFGKEKFSTEKNHEFVIFNPNSSEEKIKNDIVNGLKGKLSGDVALNFVSGSGKEHMSFLSAMMALGCGLRMVYPSEQGVKEL